MLNARHSGDLGNVFDAGCGFDLQGDDAFVVPVARVAEHLSLFMLRCGKYTERVPTVGYLAQLMAWRASSAVLIYGTRTPSAPRSRACWIRRAVIVSATPDQRFCSAIRDTAEHGRELHCVIHGTMLRVD